MAHQNTKKLSLANTQKNYL
jgi:hypothetical protein